MWNRLFRAHADFSLECCATIGNMSGLGPSYLETDVHLKIVNGAIDQIIHKFMAETALNFTINLMAADSKLPNFKFKRILEGQEYEICTPYNKEKLKLVH